MFNIVSVKGEHIVKIGNIFEVYFQSQKKDSRVNTLV